MLLEALVTMLSKSHTNRFTSSRRGTSFDVGFLVVKTVRLRPVGDRKLLLMI